MISEGHGRPRSTLMPIQTRRLVLVPCSLQVAKAVLQDRKAASVLVHAYLPDGWPAVDLRDYLPLYAEQLVCDPALLGWGIWLMIDQSGPTVIGDVGFKGRPDVNGTVEIGYSVLPAYRRQGYAGEAVRALVDWAFTQDRVSHVVAECETRNLASIRVLEKLGMRRQGQDSGLIRWRLDKPDV